MAYNIHYLPVDTFNGHLFKSRCFVYTDDKLQIKKNNHYYYRNVFNKKSKVPDLIMAYTF